MSFLSVCNERSFKYRALGANMPNRGCISKVRQHALNPGDAGIPFNEDTKLHL